MLGKGPSPIDLHVGAMIKSRRKSMRITQTALADRLGITFQQVQKYENASNRVGASRLQEIASILGVEVGYFFQGVQSATSTEGGSLTETNELQAFLSSHDGFVLNQAFYRIRDKVVRQRVIALVKALAGDLNAEEAPAQE